MSARHVVGLAIVAVLIASCAKGTSARLDGSGSCNSVTCNMPPTNVCADATNLLVYEPTGSCDAGHCNYAASMTACANGCVNDACAGDPCVGVSCMTPPANQCADATHLTVNESPGACSDGACSYTSHEEVCPNGCDNGACNGDPCIGVSCNTPPARYCTDASHLKVFDAPGTCAGGSCTYTNHDEFCAFGCVNGACQNDPCAGVSCTTPPANYCSDMNTRRVYSSPGTCMTGACSYMSTDQNCPKGCASGVCLQCMVDGDCATGQWCNGGTCASCNTNAHCGSTCANCTASGDYCNATSTMCVDCVLDNQCSAGNYCSSGTCATCNVAGHCGPSCSVCSGTTPTCGGSACVCSGSSCGAYNQCVGGACQKCNTASACGASCTACGGSTPFCLDQGATTQCVECLSTSDCTSGKTCNNGTCVAGCPAPAAACADGGDQDGSCAGAYTIRRGDAAAGFEVANVYGLCDRGNDFPSVAGCESGGSSNGADAAYKLYMKTGESIHVVLTRGASTCTSGWNGNISLKIYGTPCSANCATCAQTCSTQQYCQQSNSQNTTFTAPASGWYDIVVDSRGDAASDTGGVFDLQVTLTCPGGACTCP